MKVAVIPARGGSKRIPRKNIRDFCGKPMIAWPIEVIKQSKLFDHILVSTDDEEIAKVSKSCGAEVSFMRPAELSDDFTGTIEVIAHAVSWMHEQDWKPEAVCCIYATSVFLTKDDLLKGFDALNTGKWQYSFSATDFEYPIFRSFKERTNGGVEMFFFRNTLKADHRICRKLSMMRHSFIGENQRLGLKNWNYLTNILIL